MNAKEILKEAFDSDIQVLEKAYKADNETLQTMYILISKLIIKLIEKKILSEEDMIYIMSENEMDNLLGFDLEKIWNEIERGTEDE